MQSDITKSNVLWTKINFNSEFSRIYRFIQVICRNSTKFDLFSQKGFCGIKCHNFVNGTIQQMQRP